MRRHPTSTHTTGAGGASGRHRYPIPRRAPIEGGRNSDGDRHVIVVDRDRCRLYELRRVRGADFEVVDTSSLPRPGE